LAGLAACHRIPRAILDDLKKRGRGWLFEAARQMEKSVLADFADYSAR
jgi:hypothetical protein